MDGTINILNEVCIYERAHLEVRDDAETEKNVADTCEATHFPIRVFPVPGGPNSSTPRGGARRPVNRSLNKLKRCSDLVKSKYEYENS